jgi:hypothetical protein
MTNGTGAFHRPEDTWARSIRLVARANGCFHLANSVRFRSNTASAGLERRNTITRAALAYGVPRRNVRSRSWVEVRDAMICEGETIRISASRRRRPLIAARYWLWRSLHFAYHCFSCPEKSQEPAHAGFAIRPVCPAVAPQQVWRRGDRATPALTLSVAWMQLIPRWS